MPRRLSLLLLVALVAAGCGVRSSKPFTAKGSAPCFQTNGFTQVTTNPVKVGFIAGFAENGGLRATSTSGKVVTIAFAASADAGVVRGTQDAFRNHASPFYRAHMRDIMETNRNAVLVWSASPSSPELSAAMSCLKQ